MLTSTHVNMCGISCNFLGFLGAITFLTLIVSCERIRYYVKFVFYFAIIAVITTVAIPFMALNARDPNNVNLIAWIVTLMTKLMGVTFRIRGEENLVHNRGCVSLMNHQSLLDLSVLAELWLKRRNCTVIAKRSILYYPFFGIACWLWGTIFIDRQKSKEAYDILKETAKTVKERKANLMIFPEGHRHSKNTLLPFKKGAFHIAIATQLPIQPIVVSKYYFLKSKDSTFNSGTSDITILPAIPTEGLTLDDLPKLMDQVYDCMNKSFNETSEAVLNEHIANLKGEE